MIDYALSQQQIAVISALSTGATVTTAAEQAGVHRNTIANWRRNILPFQYALAHAQYDRALYFREKIEDLVDTAIQSVQQILADPGASPSVRLRAALAILQTASTPPEPEKQVLLAIEKIVPSKSPLQTIAVPDPAPPAVHNSAQSTPPDPEWSGLEF